MRSTRWCRLALAHLTLLALWACTSHPLLAPDPLPEVETATSFEEAPARELDLLFVIDDSGSMENKQANLARNFRVLIDELRRGPSGLPDLHLAIVSSDVGAGVTSAGTCFPGGERGRFHFTPTGNCAGLAGTDDHFIVSLGGEKTRNHTGDIADAFACLARIGTRGCGLEHQLQAARVALARRVAPPENAGFLRDRALLAVVFITDEDDCSAPPDSTVFEHVPAGININYLCYPPAATCAGQPLPATPFSRPVAACAPRPDGGGALIPVSEFVSLFRSLKDRPERVVVSAIAGCRPGEAGRYEAHDHGGGLDVDFTGCGANGGATAGMRLKDFVDSFGRNGTFSSICADDFSPAMKRIGELIGEALERNCLDAPPRDADPAAPGLQPECVVTENGGQAARALPRCARGVATPCWDLLAPGDAASTCGQRYQVVVRRSDRAAPGTYVTVRCRT